MLKQASSYLLSNYKEDEIDEVIIKNYMPDNGEYIILEETEEGFQELERSEIKKNNKTKEIDSTGFMNFDFICVADYLSKFIDSYKSIESKKLIHSNNYLTFFIRKDSISKGKLNDEIIHNYYDALRNPINKYSKSKNKLKMYECVEKELGKVDEERLNKIEQWIVNNIYDLVPKDSKEKTYLKIFFKYDLSEYEKESKKYLIPNIYNVVNYNQYIKDILYGLPNDNMGLNNGKKPYRENKTRKAKAPFLISLKEVLLQKKLFDFLMNMANKGKVNIYLNKQEIIALNNNEGLKKDFQGIYIRIKKGKELEILDFDTIEDYKIKLDPPVKTKNILQINYEKLIKKSKMYYGDIKLLETLKPLINEILFSRFLDSSYYTEAKDLSINNGNLKMNLLLSRNVLFNWFFKGRKQGVWEVLNKTSLSLIKGAINNGYIIRASEQFNLRYALKEHFEREGKSMADILKDVKDSLRKKINIKFDENTPSIENDEEYYFAVGQLTGYFISLNKSKNKPHSLANPVINARNDKRVKEELIKLYKRYNYTIPYIKGRFENLMAMVKSYEPEGTVKEDLIIAGYLHSSLIFEKTENSNDKNGGN